VRCRTRAITQLKALLIVVPAELREALQHLFGSAATALHPWLGPTYRDWPDAQAA